MPKEPSPDSIGGGSARFEALGEAVAEAGPRDGSHHRQSTVPQFRPAPKPEVSMQVAAIEPLLLDELVEGDRDRAGRGVAVAFEVLEDGVAVEAQDVAGGVDDPDVGLVGDEPADVVDPAVRPWRGRRGSSRPGSARPT